LNSFFSDTASQDLLCKKNSPIEFVYFFTSPSQQLFGSRKNKTKNSEQWGCMCRWKPFVPYL